MVLFYNDKSQPYLTRLLNSILVLLYRLQEAFFFAGLSSQQERELTIAIRHVIRFGNSFDLESYDTEI